MADDPLIGHGIGRYTIKELVGTEQLGKVFHAVDVKQQPVRIKVLEPHSIENTEALARFGREMLATATINHPNTVQMLDFGEYKSLFHYLVLEYLDARTLKEELEKLGKLPWERAVHIGAQIASALTSAHAENIVHRNLNPQNVLLLNNAVDGDYVKVRDFGLARLQTNDEAETSALTAVGKRVGTTAYMAPEYIQLAIVDPRGDVYALGVLMFEMLTGKPPYTGKTGEVLDQHVNAPVPKPSSKVSGVPAWLDALVVRMLAKNLDDRPLSALDVLATLKKEAGKPLAPPALGAARPGGITRPGGSTGPGSPAAPAPATEAEGLPVARIAVVVGLAIVAAALAVLAIVLIAVLLTGI